jgi:hypothetical protein
MSSGHGVLEHRKPLLSKRKPGEVLPRFEARRDDAPLSKPPPRTTRRELTEVFTQSVHDDE